MSTPDSTTEDILDGMLNRFRCLTAHADASDSEDEDVALATYQQIPYRQPSRDYQREMTCYLCGEKGHKIVNCPKRAGGQRAKCEYCGRVGHTIKKYFHHPDNLPTAPDWVKRMHGMKIETETNGVPNEEVGAFAFMAPESDENEVSFALFEREEADVEPSTMIVESLSEDENLPSDESEEKMEDSSSDSPSTSGSDDSTYYDPMDDDDLDSYFDMEKIEVQPPSPRVQEVIDLTNQSSSESMASNVARMSSAAGSNDDYSDHDLFPSDSSDDIKYMTVRRRGEANKTETVITIEDEEEDTKPAAIDESKTTPDEENPPPTEVIPDLELVEGLMATEHSLQDDEVLIDGDARHRTIVSFRLDEISFAAAFAAHDERSIGSSSGPMDLMANIDPELVERLNLALATGNDQDLNLMLGVIPTASNDEEDDPETMLMQVGSCDWTLTALDDDTWWVLDTGCTVHSKKTVQGGFNIRPLRGQDVVAFDGRAMPIMNKFDMRGIVMDKDDNEKVRLTLGNINHVPSARFNLFSASQAVNQGWECHVNGQRVVLTKGSQTLTFDRLVKTGTSKLYAMRIVPEGTEEVINTSVVKETGKGFEKNLCAKSGSVGIDLFDGNVKMSHDVMTSVKARKVTKQMTHYLFGHMAIRDAIASAKIIGNYDLAPGGIVVC